MKATVVNNVENTTRTVELNDNINDVATLKHFLDITDGRIFEGVTHTDLDNDRASLPQLPEDRRERGYVFFVSPAQNKTKNGTYSRKECYMLVKSHDLQEEVKRFFGGRNFTQVSTDALNNFLSSHVSSKTSSTSNTTHVQTATHMQEDENYTEKDLWKTLVSSLGDTVDAVKLNSIIDKVFPNPYSVQDIANMSK